MLLTAEPVLWDRFRGHNGSGVSSATGLPVEFGPTTNVIWKASVPFGRSSPVLTAGRVFLTASEATRLITLCLDRKTGRLLWRREIERTRVSSTYKNNDPASPSPATDGSNVYAFFADFGLISYDNKGRERWRLPLGPFDTFYGLGSSPVLHGGLLALVCDGRSGAFVIGVDKDTGREHWRVDRKEIHWEGHATPVVWSGQLLVLGANRLDAYAVETGERLWWVRGLGFLPVASPVLAGDLALVSTFGDDAPSGPTFDEWLKYDKNADGKLSKNEVPDFDEFDAIDRNRDGFIDREEWDQLRNAGVGQYGTVAIRLSKDARGDRTSDAFAWREKKNYPTFSSALVYQDVLYFAKSAGGVLVSMNPRTGETHEVGRSREAMDNYFSSPVAADGKIYFVNDAGKATVVEAGAKWKILRVNDLGEECYASPAVAPGRLYWRTRGTLYAFGKQVKAE